MATVSNPGMPGGAVDKSVTNKSLNTPFRPNGAGNLQLATTSTSQAYLLPRHPVRPDDCVRMWNSGSVPVRFRFGSDLTETCTLADKAVPPGAVEIFRCNPGSLTIAVISASAGTLEVDMGAGV